MAITNMTKIYRNLFLNLEIGSDVIDGYISHVKGKLFKRIVGFFGNLFSNIILDLKIEPIKA